MKNESRSRKLPMLAAIDPAERPEIVIGPVEGAPGLVEVDGWLVYDSGAPAGSEDTVAWIAEDRLRRMKYVSGEVDHP